MYGFLKSNIPRHTLAETGMSHHCLLQFVLLRPARREWVNKRCNRPSVCPSVAYIANNSRNQRPIAYPNLERRFSTLDATCIPVSRSNGQRSGSPGPLMLTHIVRHSFGMPRATNSNVVYGWKTTTRISYRRHDLQGQRSRSQGHVISLSRLAQC